MSAVCVPALCLFTRSSVWAKPIASQKEEMATEMERLRGLRNRLWNGIKDIEEAYLNGDRNTVRRTFQRQLQLR